MKPIATLSIAVCLLVLFIPQKSFGGNAGIEEKLTGVWNCDDGGTYYIRVIDRDVFWLGESAGAGTGWCNVFTGRLVGRKIKGSWADVPKGRADNFGTMELQLSPDGSSFSTVSGGDGFKGRNWWKSEDCKAE
jgi:hypothetical protein